MKFILASILSLLSIFAFSQCEITLQPGPVDGKDARTFGLNCFMSYAIETGSCETSNFGNSDVLIAGAWTHNGDHTDYTSLLEFDLDSLASAGCSAMEAILVLQPTGNPTQYNCGSGSTHHPCIDNSFKIHRVTNSWDENLVNYINQPSYANSIAGQDYVTVGNENDPYDSYAIDVTDMINYWLSNPSLNNGMLFKSISSAHYQQVKFASSDHIDAWRRPKLLLKLNCDNTCSNEISGKVYDDVNNNCIQDIGENGLENWLIKIEPGPIYTTTDSDGYYSAYVGNGEYTVSQIIPNTELWDTACPATYTYNLNLVAGEHAPNTDFAVKANNYCSNLTVDIAANFLRKCHTELFYVDYCNHGNIQESGVYIDISFDAGLTPLSASVPWTSNSGNVYTWNIGDLEANECGSFYIQTQVDCDVEIGDIECVVATIYPPSSCADPATSEWDNSSVMVSGTCTDENACFTISNTGDSGDGDMTGTTECRIYENGVLVHQGTIQLEGGADTLICWPGNGNSIRIEVDQRPGHPGYSHPTETIEGCGTDSGSACGEVPCILTMSADDANPFIEEECLEVVASYDPNDKTPTPFGYSVEHFIGDDDLIEYKIRFQNTGSDTAFRVVLKDQIDLSTLDISKIQLGASSHPYTFEIHSDGELNWIFDPIELVDSATNEAASMGFVKFKIHQNPGNLPGTVIENFVDIYFDYNEPVRTETAFNTIEFPQFLSVPSLYSDELLFNVYPNPTRNEVTFEFNGKNLDNLNIEVYSLNGKLVRQLNQVNLKNSLDVSSLNPGIYIYKCTQNQELIITGKLIIE